MSPLQSFKSFTAFSLVGIGFWAGQGLVPSLPPKISSLLHLVPTNESTILRTSESLSFPIVHVEEKSNSGLMEQPFHDSIFDEFIEEPLTLSSNTDAPEMIRSEVPIVEMISLDNDQRDDPQSNLIKDSDPLARFQLDNTPRLSTAERRRDIRRKILERLENRDDW